MTPQETSSLTKSLRLHLSRVIAWKRKLPKIKRLIEKAPSAQVLKESFEQLPRSFQRTPGDQHNPLFTKDLPNVLEHLRSAYLKKLAQEEQWETAARESLKMPGCLIGRNSRPNNVRKVWECAWAIPPSQQERKSNALRQLSKAFSNIEFNIRLHKQLAVEFQAAGLYFEELGQTAEAYHINSLALLFLLQVKSYYEYSHPQITQSQHYQELISKQVIIIQGLLPEVKDTKDRNKRELILELMIDTHRYLNRDPDWTESGFAKTYEQRINYFNNQSTLQRALAIVRKTESSFESPSAWHALWAAQTDAEGNLPARLSTLWKKEIASRQNRFSLAVNGRPLWRVENSNAISLIERVLVQERHGTFSSFFLSEKVSEKLGLFGFELWHQEQSHALTNFIAGYEDYPHHSYCFPSNSFAAIKSPSRVRLVKMRLGEKLGRLAAETSKELGLGNIEKAQKRLLALQGAVRDESFRMRSKLKQGKKTLKKEEARRESLDKALESINNQLGSVSEYYQAVRGPDEKIEGVYFKRHIKRALDHSWAKLRPILKAKLEALHIGENKGTVF